MGALRRLILGLAGLVLSGLFLMPGQAQVDRGVYPSELTWDTDFRTSCATVFDLAATDDNIEFWMPVRYVVFIQQVGCHCRGTCTTPAQIQLSDRAANVMHSVAATCSSGSGNTTFTNVVSPSGHNRLLVGEGLRFSVTNTPNPSGLDEYTICFAYSHDPTVP